MQFFGGTMGDSPLLFATDAKRVVMGPTNVKTGASIAADPWSREGMLLATARVSPENSYRATEAAAGTPLPPATVKAPAFVQAPAPADSGVPTALLVGGAAVGALALGFIAWRLL